MHFVQPYCITLINSLLPYEKCNRFFAFVVFRLFSISSIFVFIVIISIVLLVGLFVSIQKTLYSLLNPAGGRRCMSCKNSVISPGSPWVLVAQWIERPPGVGFKSYRDSDFF